MSTNSSKNNRRGLQRGLAMLGIALVAGFAVLVTGYTVAVQRENDDAFCASCHTEPESTYYELTQNDPNHDLAAWHAGEETRCIDCHSDKGVPGRLSAMVNGAQDLLSYQSGNYHQPVTTTRPVGNAGCTKCHDMPVAIFGEAGEGRSLTGQEGYDGHYHADVLLLGWRARGGPKNSCAACHPAHLASASADFEVGFLEQAVVEQQCDNCHAQLGEGGREGGEHEGDDD